MLDRSLIKSIDLTSAISRSSELIECIPGGTRVEELERQEYTGSWDDACVRVHVALNTRLSSTRLTNKVSHLDPEDPDYIHGWVDLRVPMTLPNKQSDTLVLALVPERYQLQLQARDSVLASQHPQIPHT